MTKIEIFLLIFIFFGVFIPGNIFAIDIPIFALIISENSPGYICSGDSFGCSALSSIYKIEMRNNDLYICPGGSLGNCLLSDNFYKINIYDEDTTYICPIDSFSCSSFNDLYRVEKYDADTTFVCSGDSFSCSSFNDLYRIKQYNTDTTYVCPGDAFSCSSFNDLYRFEKSDNQSSGYSGTNYDDQIQEARDKLAQLEEEERKLTEDYLNTLNDLNAYTQNLPQYTCPTNSTLNGTKCTCDDGYVVYNNQCVTYADSCSLNYGDHVFVKMINGRAHCDCEMGYAWNQSVTTCIKEVKQVQSSPKIMAQKTDEPTSIKNEETSPADREQQIQQNQQEEGNRPEEIISGDEGIDNEEPEKQNSIKSISLFITNTLNNIKNFFYRIFYWR